MRATFVLLVCLTVLILSCSTLKTSQYAKDMKFTYTNEQPSPYFKNDELNIAGAFWWASNLRDIPKVSFLPDTIKKILRPISKEHGPVLFSAFYPAAIKYRNAKYMFITKSEVRQWHKYLEPFFEVVLVSEKPLKRDTAEYKPVGFTADGSYTLYFRKPELRRNSYWVMETIAADDDIYYTFIVLMSKHHNMGDSATAATQSKMFIADVQQYFEKPAQPGAVQSTSRTTFEEKSGP